LTQQVSNPVRWLQSVENLVNLGVETFIEVGAGKVLCGLVKQINRDVRCMNVENSASLLETRNNL
jgi:[acyl-carrier-protein] S-malonyltransferase